MISPLINQPKKKKIAQQLNKERITAGRIKPEFLVNGRIQAVKHLVCTPKM